MNFKNTVLFSGIAVLLILMLNASINSSFAAIEYEHKTKWDSKGLPLGQFSQPGGVAADY